VSDLIKIQSADLELLQTGRQTGLTNVFGFIVSVFVVNATRSSPCMELHSCCLLWWNC